MFCSEFLYGVTFEPIESQCLERDIYLGLHILQYDQGEP